MQALVTGAAGFVGHELISQLHLGGVPVIAAVGPLQSDLERLRLGRLRELGIQILDLDLRRELPFAEAPTDWNVLFHLAAYVQTERDSRDVSVNDIGTRRLLTQLPLESKRVVYTSTLAVADDTPDGRVTADTSCRPRTDYGRTKLAAEHIVREVCSQARAAFTVLRLPTIYGRGFRSGGIFDVLARRLERNERLARIAWPGRLALLSVQDAASMLHRVASAEGTRNRSFLASSNDNPAVWEIAATIAAARGVAYRPIPLPAPVAVCMNWVLGRWWQSEAIPYAIQIAAWRARLLLKGLYCQDSELADLLGMTFGDWRVELAAMY